MKPQRRLVLFPQNAESPAVAPNIIVDHLSVLGLIGSKVQSSISTYLPGPDFMRLITFVGCSPVVSVDDGDDNEKLNQYFIEVSVAENSIATICGANKIVPRCPQCRRKPSGWQPGDVIANSVLVCDQCGMRSPLHKWDWRHQAGFGRCWINIQGVHEGEAVPGEKLLNTLHKSTGLIWNYAWCRD